MRSAKTLLGNLLRSLAWLIIVSGWIYWVIWLIRDVPSDLPAVAAAEKLVPLFILAFGGLGALATRWIGRSPDKTTQPQS